MSTSLQNLTKMQLMHNQAFRTILMAGKYTSIMEMYANLNSSLLHDRRDIHMALECHRDIYFDGQASFGHFYVLIVRPGNVHMRHEDSKHMFVPRVLSVTACMKAYSTRGPRFGTV